MLESIRNGLTAAHDLGAMQHGVVHRRQLLDQGLSTASIRRLVDRGTVRYLLPTVLTFPAVPATFQRDLMASCLSVGGVASHESAAFLHEMWLPARGRRVVVSTLPGTRHRAVLGRLHVYADLVDEVCEVVGAIPVTNRTRTVIDLAAILSAGDLREVLDRELVQGSIDIDCLARMFQRTARRGRHGSGRLRLVLEERLDASAVAESILEREFLDLLRGADLPLPEIQVELDGIGRVDALFREQRAIFELDGRAWHSRFADFERDRRRDQAAQLLGYRVFRIGAEQLRRHPGEVIRLVRSVVGASDPSWHPDDLSP